MIWLTVWLFNETTQVFWLCDNNQNSFNPFTFYIRIVKDQMVPTIHDERPVGPTRLNTLKDPLWRVEDLLELVPENKMEWQTNNSVEKKKMTPLRPWPNINIFNRVWTRAISKTFSENYIKIGETVRLESCSQIDKHTDTQTHRFTLTQTNCHENITRPRFRRGVMIRDLLVINLSNNVCFDPTFWKSTSVNTS